MMELALIRTTPGKDKREFPTEYLLGGMEDSIEIFLQEQNCTLLRRYRENRTLTLVTGAVFSGVYGLWVMFCMPGLRVPFRLKVPYLPSTSAQTQNVMKLLDGRRGRLADLGSGDGRLVFAACSSGFQCTGFEINSVLLAYSRGQAWWRGIRHTKATFINQDFWKTDLSKYSNVIAFLAPDAMQDLEEKLMEELPDDGRVVVCRFPLPRWPHSSTRGAGLDQVWAYDVCTARHGTHTSSLKPQPKSDVAQ
ncbi:protein FAM173B-like isoform X1 [Astyanax mexicanus]|uniref:Protein FAM173B-like isoform X1 n=1 Tax=Astyanax mexicanus TaxID=7994 RepID=A0A8T2KZ76_ASTMX|nr:protein FAM173B-like isoform X1 [Astyanax mexicanus]